MNPDGMLKPALIGGVLLGILSAVPVLNLANCLCCAWVVGGGVLSAHLYVKNSSIRVSLGSGVALGMLTGAIGAIVNTLFNIPFQIVLQRLGSGFGEPMREILDQVPNLPPETRQVLEDAFNSSGGIGVPLIILSGFFLLVIYSFMGMLGGAIGVALFEQRRPGEESDPTLRQTPYPPPPPPPTDPPSE